MKIKMAGLVLFFLNIATSQATVTRSFDSLWSEFYQKSFQKKSLELEKEANELSLARSKRHWLPRAYVAGQWFQTNDSAMVFFNNLGQRSIEAADFIPSDLNHPGRQTFKTATLGLDFPLYEGGVKSSQSSLFESLVIASDLDLKAKKSEEYAELGRQYGSVLVNSRHGKELVDLKQNLEKILANYQVGSQSNPVGYSGLLGLKGIKNRIDGLLFEFNLKISQGKKWINAKADIADDWLPLESLNLSNFLNENFLQPTPGPFSSMLLAEELKVNSMENIKDMERSRLLPRVGLFAQNNLYMGSRDDANSQAYGIYLAWDIFNGDSFGRVGEANAKLLSSQAKLKASKQDEKIVLEQLLESKITLEKSLELLDNSDALLKEQTVNVMKLFKSGMISALQLSEVMNRRVDLLENKNKAQTQYLDIYSKIYQINN